MPAIHFSKRGLFDRNASLWCGFHAARPPAAGPVHRRHRLRPGVRRDGATLPPPDLALVPIGAYEPRPLMQGSHCTPEEGVRIGRDWGARRLCGMHWGTIRLTDEPAFEPPGRFKAAATERGLWRSGRLGPGDRRDAQLVSAAATSMRPIEGPTPRAVVWCIIRPSRLDDRTRRWRRNGSRSTVRAGHPETRDGLARIETRLGAIRHRFRYHRDELNVVSSVAMRATGERIG